MKSPTRSARWSVGVVVAGLAITLDASACLQGYVRPPDRKPSTSVPIPPLMDDVLATKLEMPKPEPLRIEGLPRLSAATAAELIGEEAEREKFGQVVREFEARPAGEKAEFEDATNYAVALVHLGRSPRAIEVLLALEAKVPGVYTTAANLGTAYELTGNLEAALKWIEAGIERNTGSHQGTEWLHVAILRAKINLRTDPAWLAKHSVLDVAAGREAGEVLKAIDYQLGERLHFVKPVDPVVCDLFYQAALRVTGDQAEERRAQYLRESLRYGDWRKTEAERRLKS